MGIKLRIVLGLAELAALLLVRLYALKLIRRILPAGSRVRELPDGTPVVSLDQPAYYEESFPGETHETDLSGSESPTDKDLREEARGLLHWWKLPWRNKFHKLRRRNNRRKPVYALLDDPFCKRSLPTDEQLDAIYRKPIPRKAK